MLERTQRALIKFMYFKNITLPTDHLYVLSRLLIVRKLCVMHIILKKHKSLPNGLHLENKRSKGTIAHAPRNRTFLLAFSIILLLLLLCYVNIRAKYPATGINMF